MKRMHPFILSVPDLDGSMKRVTAPDLMQEIFEFRFFVRDAHSIEKLANTESIIWNRVFTLEQITEDNRCEKEKAVIRRLQRLYVSITNNIFFRIRDLRRVGYR